MCNSGTVTPTIVPTMAPTIRSVGKCLPASYCKYPVRAARENEAIPTTNFRPERGNNSAKIEVRNPADIKVKEVCPAKKELFIFLPSSLLVNMGSCELYKNGLALEISVLNRLVIPKFIPAASEYIAMITAISMY